MGGFSDAARHKTQSEKANAVVQSTVDKKTEKKTKATQPAVKAKTTKKLSYKMQLELDALPRELETLENKVEELQAMINTPEFYTKDKNEADKFLAELASTAEKLEVAFERWEHLEELQNGE